VEIADGRQRKPCLNQNALDATFPRMKTPPSDFREPDAFDRRILQEIQNDSTIGPAELSTRVHLSISQCSRRLQRLRDRGIIDRSVTVLDRKQLNLGLTAVLLIKLGNHSTENEQKFLAQVNAMAEVTACHYVTGDLDFILQITTRDLESYDILLRQRLLPSADISECRSNIVLRTNKETTVLPLDFL
jgi:DNA-binding Lrp family transcriptional regulator